MKVLLANGNPIERKRLAGVLAGAGYQVVEAAAGAAASKALDELVLDGALVDWPLAAGLVPSLRARDRPYLVLTHAQWSPQDIGAAYALGADDLMKSPACKEEVLGRMDGLRRLRARMHESAGRDRDFSAAFDLMQVRAWREMEAIIARDLGDLFCVPLAPEPFGSYSVARSSQISLILSSDQIEVRLGIGADAAGSAAVAQILLSGDARPEALGDALRELANTAGGALKRAAMADDVQFTLGLPTDGNLFVGSGAPTHRWLVRGPDGLCLAVAATIASAVPSVVPASSLREGMVIARDVVNSAGLLLASAGTYLTRISAERLAKLAGPSTLVDVTEAAAAPSPVAAAAAG